MLILMKKFYSITRAFQKAQNTNKNKNTVPEAIFLFTLK